MKKLYFVNTNDDLIEGVFNENRELLDAWSPNDANWSHYFDGFMQSLGFDIVYGDEELEDTLRRYAMELWGLNAEEAMLED
jgi:hypothetical protein